MMFMKKELPEIMFNIKEIIPIPAIMNPAILTAKEDVSLFFVRTSDMKNMAHDAKKAENIIRNTSKKRVFSRNPKRN